MREGASVKSMSPLARAFVYATLALGVGLLVWSQPSLPATENQRVLLAVLALGAACSQLFPVAAAREHAYYVTPIFLIAGLLLLPPGSLSLLLILAFVPVVLLRHSSWHAQFFNFGNLTLDAFLARTLYVRLQSGASDTLVEPQALLAALAAAAFFIVANHGFLAVSLYLARGESARETRLFSGENLLVDFALCCTGILIALLWQLSPWLVGLTLASLLLTYRALKTFPLQEQARTDAKTGLYNSRYFAQVLEGEFRRAARYKRPLSVIMADLDLLRNINNNYGHLAGDAVLRGVARVITNGLREYDLAARFGGEEFAIVLPETDSADAHAVAQRLRKGVEDARFEVATTPEPLQATLSLGVASYPAHGQTPSEVVHQADLAVYYAKLRGRNRVWVSSAESAALRPTMRASPAEENASFADETATTPAPQGAETVRERLLAATLLGAATEEQSAPTDTAGATAGSGPTAARSLEEMKAKSGDRVAGVTFPLAVWAVALLTSVVLLWLRYQPWQADLDWLGLGTLACLVVVGESLAIHLPGRRKVFLGAIFALAAGMVFAWPGALVVAPVIAVATLAFGRNSFSLLPFYLGNATLGCVAAAGFYVKTAALLPSAETALLVLPAAVAGAVYFVVDTALLSLSLALARRTSIFAVWNQRYRALFPYYLVWGELALLCTLSFLSSGLWGLLYFVGGPLLLYLVMRRDTERTLGNVADLKRANEELVKAHDEALSRLQALRAMYDDTIMEFAAAIDSRDAEASGHSNRVAAYTELIARELGMAQEEIEGLLNGALLHDIGKMAVPDSILRKPGPLTLPEWSIMRTHAEEGYRMVRHIPFLAQGLPIIRYHHERYDGKGYPQGLKGNDIPLSARIFAVADAYESMTVDRPFRSASSLVAAREEVARCAGGQFDPRVVEAFLLVNVQDLKEVAASRVAPVSLNGRTVGSASASAAAT